MPRCITQVWEGFLARVAELFDVHEVSERRLSRALLEAHYSGFWVSVLICMPRDARNPLPATAAPMAPQFDDEAIQRAAREPGEWDVDDQLLTVNRKRWNAREQTGGDDAPAQAAV
eukprot:3427807-Prymnesium_polylepis.1